MTSLALMFQTSLRCGLLGLMTVAEPLVAQAQVSPSLNLSGQTGLIDMPSGDQQPDGFLSFDHSRFGGIGRNTLQFQIGPRLSGVFRYVGLHDYENYYCQPDCTNTLRDYTYYDRNFDISYQILNEGRFWPAVSIGVQDFVGTGLFSAEYIVGTKALGPRLKVTGGVGFGRLGSYNAFGHPLGPREAIDFGNGGNLAYKQWFKGDAAVFGGVEYQIAPRWAAKVEYSSDAYSDEADTRKMFDHKSPMNYGVEYHPNATYRLGVYAMYGSEIGVNLSATLNPDQRPLGGMGGPAPAPVAVRPAKQVTPAAWAQDWTAQPGATEAILRNMTVALKGSGIVIDTLGLTATTAQVRFRNLNYDATAQAIGRVARAMTRTLPASVEEFQIVPVDHGMAGTMAVLARADLERFEFAPDGATLLRAQTQIVPPDRPLVGTKANPDPPSRLTWSLLPFVHTRQFDPANPLQAALGLRLSSKYELAQGLYLSGSVTDLLVSGISESGRGANSVLPHVRSESILYDTQANPDIETLTLAYFAGLAPNVYGRVTAGYLERGFAGLSAELLYRPVDRLWALGFEADSVAQRDTDGRLGFGQYDYSVATGHVSGYLDLGRGYHAQVDMGRYLAGDVGATLHLTREFENGWSVGAFATKTDVSAEDFGEGSFDKGITLQIPFAWFYGKPTRATAGVTIRPVGRDGGAKLGVPDRLYSVLRSYDLHKIDAQWGRVWK